MNSYPVLLVIEDDPDDFYLLKRALWKVGATARVWWARDCTEACAVLAEIEHGTAGIVVVLDVQLSGSDGFEVLDRLRTKPYSARVKFAFLTGREDAATKERAQACTAEGFFYKEPSNMLAVARSLQQLAVSALPCQH